MTKQSLCVLVALVCALAAPGAFAACPAGPPALTSPGNGAQVPLAQASGLYVARTYAYVANGKGGLAIVDVERPERMREYQRFTAGGKITDAQDVIVATTNASLYM